MEPFLVTMVPTDFGEFSSHDGQEFLYVLEGEIRARWASKSRCCERVTPSTTTRSSLTS